MKIFIQQSNSIERSRIDKGYHTAIECDNEPLVIRVLEISSKEVEQFLLKYKNEQGNTIPYCLTCIKG